MMMARGKVVVDENVTQIVDALRGMNILVSTPRCGTPDVQIITDYLFNQIFITRNTKDFLKYAPTFYIGLISLEGLDFIDPEKDAAKNITVGLISQAIIQYKLWSKKDGFLLELKENGKHKFTSLKL